MVRKSLIISLGLFVIMFYQMAGECFAEEEPLYHARVNVCSLIDSGKYTEAASATNALVSNFSGNTGLPESLYWIAERYERYDKFDGAGQFYQQIIQNYPNSDWANKATLAIARANIKSLIVAGKYGSAKTAIGGLIAAYNSNPDLPEALFWITERFQRADRLEDANQYYQKIIDDFPQSPYAEKTRLRLATVNTLSLLKSQDYDGAKAALDKLITDFAGNSDLPDAIFWTAERFMRVDRFDDAIQYYQKIIDNFPNNSLADNAKFWLVRATIESQIVSQNYDGAQSSLANFMSDYNSSPDLPEALYWISERYERLGRFDDSIAIYQQLSQSLDSPWSNKAKLGISRANVMSLIVSGKYDDANEALNKFTADFSGNSRLSASLYWIAERYQRQNRFQEANDIYQQIIKNYPGGDYANRAKLDVSRIGVLSLLIVAQDYNGAQTAFDKMVADFNGRPLLTEAAFRISDEFYSKGFNTRNDPNEIVRQQAKDRLKQTAEILEKIITALPESEPYTASAHYLSGNCYYLIGNDDNDYNKAIDYYKEALAKWPDNPHACAAQCLIGICYESLQRAKANRRRSVPSDRAGV